MFDVECSMFVFYYELSHPFGRPLHSMKTPRVSLLLSVGICLFSLTAPAQDFVPIKGTYYGVFFEADGSWSDSSGSITISTTSRGTYSASLQRGFDFRRFAGRFDSNGSDSRRLVSFFSDSLTVDLQVDPADSDTITGTVTDGVWVADLSAYRAVFDGRTNISPDAGKYTMILPGDFTSTTTPGGNSLATITVDRAGRLRVSGEQADAWNFFQSTRVSKSGQWPFYFPAYWGRGSLHGWLQLNAPDNSAISGDVMWVKRRISWDWYYPDGFAITVSASGSQYLPPPPGTRIIDIASATIELNGGNLSDGITNSITLDANNHIHNLGPNNMNLRFSTSNGFFRGAIADPNSWDWIPFHGVVLQDRAVATGYFPGWDQTGKVLLQGD
jgi:hypothetical protein